MTRTVHIREIYVASLLQEYHKNENLVIDSAEMNNVVYMFRCQDSALTVKGKVNSIVMDSCRKSSVVLDSVVSSIEFVNCQSVQMQVSGLLLLLYIRLHIKPRLLRNDVVPDSIEKIRR